jgi:hypothetical protein
MIDCGKSRLFFHLIVSGSCRQVISQTTDSALLIIIRIDIVFLVGRTRSTPTLLQGIMMPGCSAIAPLPGGTDQSLGTKPNGHKLYMVHVKRFRRSLSAASLSISSFVYFIATRSR